jgi:hypothetical protein
MESAPFAKMKLSIPQRCGQFRDQEECEAICPLKMRRTCEERSRQL